jgi:hypothetical protein
MPFYKECAFNPMIAGAGDVIMVIIWFDSVTTLW